MEQGNSETRSQSVSKIRNTKESKKGVMNSLITVKPFKTLPLAILTEGP